MIPRRKKVAAGVLAALLALGLFGAYGLLQSPVAQAQMTPGVTVIPTDLFVDEGAGARYAVVLDTEPSDTVTVTVNDPSNPEVTADPGSLTFTVSNWYAPQSVTLSAAHDSDADDETEFDVTHTVTSTDSDYDGINISDVAVSVIDDDKAVHISATTLEIDEGGSASYTVVLESQPTANVSVIVGGFAGTDLTLGNTTLNFTTGNWDTEQAVTVTAGQDDDGAADTTRLTHTISSTDGGYEGLSTVGVTVTVADDETAGVTLSLTDTELNIDEGDSSDYTVVLDTQPTADVTIKIEKDGHFTIKATPDELVFTTQNWSTAQTVEVSTREDFDYTDNAAEIRHQVRGGDYSSGVTVDTVEVTSVDDDPELAFIVEETVYSVVENEGQVRVGFTIETTEPGAPSQAFQYSTTSQGSTATAGLCGSDLDYRRLSSDTNRVLPDYFVPFVDADGQIRYRFTYYVHVGILNDDLPEETENFEVVFEHSPGFFEFSQVAATVEIIDDDFVGVSVASTAISVAEGTTSSYLLALGTQPDGDVTISINDPSNGEVTAEPGSLTFTPTDWYLPQAVTVTAEHDIDEVDEQPVVITHTVSATDADYDGLNADNVTVTVKDDDDPGVAISEVTLETTEGESTSYEVALDTQPQGEVTVAIEGTAGTGLLLDPAVLTFTNQDWSVPQTVTVTAPQDDDAVDEADALSHSASSAADTDYDGLTASLTVAVEDDETAGVTVTPTELTIDEGTSSTYAVALDSQPEGGVTVAIAGFADTALSVDRETATFTSQNWNIPQEVTVTPLLDAEVGVNPRVTISHTVSSSSDDVYGGLNADSVTVTVRDLATTGITVAPTVLTIDEGTTATYMVALDTQPTADVTVNISHTTTVSEFPPHQPLNIDPSSLTFTTHDWSTPQTVNVEVKNDSNQVDEFSMIRHQVEGGDYSSGVSVSNVEVFSRDNDPIMQFAAQDGVLQEGMVDGRIGFVAVTVDSRIPVRNYVVDISILTDSATSMDFVLPHEDYDPDEGFDIWLNAENFSAFVDGAGQTRYRQVFYIDVEIIDDGVVEPRESFSFELNCSGKNTALISVTMVDVVIIDNDGVIVAPTTLPVVEGASSTYQVVLDNRPTNIVTVTINDPTNTEITAAPASLTFRPRDFSTPQTVTVSASHDADKIDEQPAVITHTVTSPDSRYNGYAADSVTVNVTDNDVPQVTVSFDAATYAVDEGGTVEVKVTLSDDPERTVTIPIEKANQGTATDDDYSGVPADVTFISGDTEETFTFSATPDTLNDDDESVKLTIGDLPTITGLTLTKGAIAESVVSITDVPSVTVSFGASAYTVAESDDASTMDVTENEVVVTVKLSADPERAVVIPIEKANQGTATDDDYSGVPANVTFNSGDTEVTFTFAATHDTVDDDNESVKLTFGSPLPDGVSEDSTNAASVVSITDDDDPAVNVSFGASAYTVAESDDAATTVEKENEVVVKVTLSADPERTVVIPIEKANQGTATDDDYSGVPANVTFNSGDTEVTFTFTAKHDTANDDGETVKLTFGSPLPDGVSEGATKVSVVSITDDDDPAVKVSFGQATYAVAEGSAVDVTVTLSADPERTVTITIGASPQNGATADDYLLSATSLIFGATETSKTITFTAEDDSDNDDDETVKLYFGSPLPSGVSEGDPAETEVSIRDGDLPAVLVSFGESSYTVAEGGTVDVTVSLSEDPERTVTIPIAKTNQNGATDSDYSDVPTRVMFMSGETEQTFTVRAIQDNLQDVGESVKLAFENLPTDVSAGTNGEATVNISNVAAQHSLTVNFGYSTYSVTEGGSTQVTIRLNAAPGTDATIQIAATGQGGATTADYSIFPASVTFTGNETEKTITFTANDDSVYDDNETVKLSFVNLPAGVTGGSTAEATVIITDLVGVEPNPEEPTARIKCDNDANRTILLDRVSSIDTPGEKDYWTVELHPIKNYIIEVIGAKDGLDILGQKSYSGELTLEFPDIFAVWNSDRSRRTHEFVTDGDHSHSGGETDHWVVLVKLGTGSPQIEVGSVKGVTGRYQIKVRLNNICDDRDGALVYPWGGGPEGYMPYLDTPGNKSTEWELYATTEPDFRGEVGDGYLGDHGEDEPDEDWFQVDLDEGYEYTFELSADTRSPEKYQATDLKIIGIHDPQGAVIAGTASSGSGESVSVKFTPPANGTYFIAVGSGGNDHTGFYEISVNGSPEGSGQGNQGRGSSGSNKDTKDEQEQAAPSAPRKLSAAANADGSITLTWKAPDTAGVTGYQILRSRPTEGEDTLMIIVEDTGSAQTSYTDTDVTPDVLHVYRVKAINDAGVGERSDKTEVTPLDPTTNTPATGRPKIIGEVRVREKLLAQTSGIKDADGLSKVSYGYQWIAGGSDISGATGSSYTLTKTDEGLTIQVRVKFTDDVGNQETMTSPATEAVAAKPNSPATGAPTISGTARVGETLSADTSGISDDDGLTNVSYSYQWLAGGTDLSGATGSTYTLTASEQGKTLRVRVSFTDDARTDESLTSAATDEVEPAVQPQKANSQATGEPTISGTARVGETLTANISTIADDDGLEDATFSYQWIRNDGASDTDIAGASGSTYTLDAEDEGKTIRVRVSFTDDADNEETLTSAATAAVAAKPNSPATGEPTISGTARVGETLTANTSGITDDDGLTNVSYSYQWLAGGTDLSGATGSTYTLTAAEQGKTVQVRVSFTDDRGYSETVTSGATAAVAAPEPPAKPTGLSTASVSHNTVTIIWDDPQDDSITGYVILRRDPEIHPSGTFITLTSNTGAADTNYTDDTVEPEKQYVYRIQAINKHGVVSERSGWVRADTPAAPAG